MGLGKKDIRPEIIIILIKYTEYHNVYKRKTNFRFMDNKVAVATVTYYDLNKPDMVVRSHLALKTIMDALKSGCGVFVVDGGSTKSFVNEARLFGATVLVQDKNRKGISGGQQQAIECASRDLNPDAYILIEPEKAGLIGNYFEQIMSPISSGSADIALIGRTEDSMRTLTRMQRLTETRMNADLSKMLGIDADFCMAPRVWNADVTPYFLNYTPSKNWDLFHGPVIDAMRDGKRIVPVRIPYAYPAEMIAAEEGVETYEKKRIDQLMEVTDFVREYLGQK